MRWIHHSWQCSYLLLSRIYRLFLLLLFFDVCLFLGGAALPSLLVVVVDDGVVRLPSLSAPFGSLYSIVTCIDI